jgi:hypothetical protein
LRRIAAEQHALGTVQHLHTLYTEQVEVGGEKGWRIEAVHIDADVCAGTGCDYRRVDAADRGLVERAGGIEAQPGVNAETSPSLSTPASLSCRVSSVVVVFGTSSAGSK